MWHTHFKGLISAHVTAGRHPIDMQFLLHLSVLMSAWLNSTLTGNRHTHTHKRMTADWCYVRNAVVLLSPGCDAWNEAGNRLTSYNFPEPNHFCCFLFCLTLTRVTSGLPVTIKSINHWHPARETIKVKAVPEIVLLFSSTILLSWVTLKGVCSRKRAVCVCVRQTNAFITTYLCHTRSETTLEY